MREVPRDLGSRHYSVTVAPLANPHCKHFHPCQLFPGFHSSPRKERTGCQNCFFFAGSTISFLLRGTCTRSLDLSTSLEFRLLFYTPAAVLENGLWMKNACRVQGADLRNKHCLQPKTNRDKKQSLKRQLDLPTCKLAILL